MAVSPSGAPIRAVTRTCIGCRHKATAAELLRVVVDPAARADTGFPVQVVPDPRRCAPGRGAWLHPHPECVALAERRKAFARALRCAVAVDPAPVREYVQILTERKETEQ